MNRQLASLNLQKQTSIYALAHDGTAMWYNSYIACASASIAEEGDSLRRNPKRAIGFEEAQEIFEHPYYQDQRSDDPEQYRSIGWVQGQLFTLIFEQRNDREGEFCHLVTLWPATKEERELYEANS